MEITLQFLGAAQNVTGSCYLLNANGKNIIIDCGLYQEHQLKSRNWEPLPVAADKIDAVLLTHAHLDHCGRLPRLYKTGFRGTVYSTEATADMARIVMADSARIQTEDAEYKKKRHARQNRRSRYEPQALYSIEDVQGCMSLFQTTDYHRTIKISKGIEAVFYNGGHILGAAAIQIRISQSGQTRTILFSGDVGRWDMPILHDPEAVDQADFVICESTYGDKVHKTSPDIKQSLCDTINLACKKGGNVIIPSFAIERSQDLLYYLNELMKEKCLPQLLVFLDSPMAVKITEIFEKYPDLFDKDMTRHIQDGTSPFDLPGLSLIHSAWQSKAINHIRGTAIIISGSGMCTGGRIKHHLANNISRPENTILFVGYQAQGTLGRQILEGQSEVRIFGEMFPVKADITKINGFSAHADRNELTRWLGNLKQPPRHLFVTHGEAQVAGDFASHINATLGWQTSVPQYGEIAILS
ncbi:MAG: MBL fold metallo-hydrolase [Sedimentisphaerales bacterium]|nr:MBL fold metallo-hydrolase [Sedimentisphaerales bacterium]MBN2842655.1 MBL fold metallo-hydrolase [Sedimentisphaerales bacterium]